MSHMVLVCCVGGPGGLTQLVNARDCQGTVS